MASATGGANHPGGGRVRRISFVLRAADDESGRVRPLGGESVLHGVGHSPGPGALYRRAARAVAGRVGHDSAFDCRSQEDDGRAIND